jgi:hypothetical protein
MALIFHSAITTSSHRNTRITDNTKKPGALAPGSPIALP